MAAGAEDLFVQATNQAVRLRLSFDLSSPEERMTGQIAAYFQRQPTNAFLWSRLLKSRSSVAEKAAAALLEHQVFRFPPFEPVTLQTNLTWAENPFKNRSWQWALHSFAWMDQLLGAHLTTQREAYFSLAKYLVQDWMADNLKSPGPSEFSWSDHSTALRLVQLLDFWELWRFRAESDPAFTARLLETLTIHGRLLCSEEFYVRHTNHGFDQANALLVLALAIPECAQAAEWRTTGLERLLDECAFAFTPEGIHKENSPAYHFIMARRIAAVRDMFCRYGIDCPRLDELIEASVQVGKYLVLPNGQLPLLGDTDTNASPLCPTPADPRSAQELEYVLSRGAGGVAPPQLDLVLPQSGYAIFRSGWPARKNYEQAVHLIFKAATFSTYHFHDDVLTFSLYGHGERWIEDGGLYKYAYEDPFRKYLQHRRAHNVVVVDNQEVTTEPRPILPQDFRAKTTAAWAFVQATYRIGDAVEHTRQILYSRPDQVFVHDRLRALDHQTHDYKQVFHIDAQKQVAAQGDGFLVKASAGDGWTLAVRSGFGAPTPHWVRGQKVPYHQGWISYKVAEIEPTYALGFEAKGENAEFRTSLSFHKGTATSNSETERHLEQYDWDLEAFAAGAK